MLSWSSDGRYLLYRSGMTLTREIKVLALRGEHKTIELLDIKSTGAGGALSPDSKWLAYVSAESGSPQEIYVVPFRSTSEHVGLGEGKLQITSGGASVLRGVVTAKKCTFPAIHSSVSPRSRLSRAASIWK